MSNIIDGKAISDQIKSEVAAEVGQMREKGKQPPGLAVVLVGDNKASQVYVSMKKKACDAAGIFSLEIRMPAEVSQAQLLKTIEELNRDSRIHGILVQLPLPSHLDEQAILNHIDPRKDVDGFHPINVGNLSLKIDSFVACTPLGVMEMLKRNGVDVAGKNALVLGRSNIVGKPMAMLLTNASATVTVAHSKTRDLPEQIGRAEILVAAIGKPEFVKGAWIKEGAVVIDVGINSIDDPSSAKGYRLVGDVEYEAAARRASKITPVPGGVGPMTIAMLLSNTLKARKKYFNQE
ncbi:MAG: bifunctional methylenetetrahydrofolate dehydrogenase/methenyltetrahydrofolate cyclohydrolase FolD [Candidatus Riflebacteria bacterium]